MKQTFHDGVTVVTGGTGGIGMALIEALQAEGMPVACVARAEGAADLNVQCDLMDEGAVSSAMQTVERELGPIASLVCSAGVVAEAPVAEMELDDWQHVIDVSLLGTFLASRAVLPGMIERRYGRIVAMSSGYGRKGYRNGANYAAAKGGIEALIKSIALEVAEFGITANAISPGPIVTKMLDAPLARPGWEERINTMIPMGRVGEPDEVVGPTFFFLSEQSVYVTGQVLHVNGGMLMP